MKGELIIGHRGAPRLAHENTLESFQKAIDLGVDMVELDVRTTKDGELAVLHNPYIGGKKISDLTFAQINYIAKTKNYSVPSLREALSLLAGKADVLIEIKQPDCEQAVAQTALKFLSPERFYIISFYSDILFKIKKTFPQIKIGLDIGVPRWDFKPLLHFFANSKVLLEKIDLICPNRWLITLGFLKLFPGNLPVMVWPINRENEILRLLKNPKITGIMSDCPDIALKLKSKIYAP